MYKVEHLAVWEPDITPGDLYLNPEGRETNSSNTERAELAKIDRVLRLKFVRHRYLLKKDADSH